MTKKCKLKYSEKNLSQKSYMDWSVTETGQLW
jgi:hypothetical protein